MEDNSNSMAPAMPHHSYDSNVDYVISDYMERLGTRLNILETELKYAWRALDLLSQEYIKMWERLEKLEGLLYEQQSVISQLLDFYTTGGARCDIGGPEGSALDGRLGELEVIREILGNGTVEDGLEEGVDVSRSQQAVIKEIELDMDEIRVPDEAFYRSLNQAYREDLVGCEPPRSTPQLGMIWEEREETEDNEKKDELRKLEEELRMEESQEVYSAMDYKDYRGNSPCVSEQDLAQLSRISSIDQVTIEKLNELDRLSTKLQQDSMNIKQLQRKLLESPHANASDGLEDSLSDKSNIIDEKLRQIYNESESWNFSHTPSMKEQDNMLMLSKADLSHNNRPNSRLSVSDSVIGTDTEVAETMAGAIRTPTSPRRRALEIPTCNAPYTTVTGRLAYNAAVQNIDSAASKNPFTSKNPFFNGVTDYNDIDTLLMKSYENVTCSSPFTMEKPKSPTLSVCSLRTRQDGYVSKTSAADQVVVCSISQSPSPPPPAPSDTGEQFLIALSTSAAQRAPSPVFLGTETVPSMSITNQEHGRLSPKPPHSPKSPKCSPKRSKSQSSTIVAAKSDSGLSSMSGWSSLEKSPGSPKNGKKSLEVMPRKIAIFSFPGQCYARHQQQQHVTNSPLIPLDLQHSARPFTESDTDSFIPNQVPACNAILPGGHHLSAFTTVKSPCSFENPEGYGTFVPAPAPASDINVSPRRKTKHHHPSTKSSSYGEYMYRNDQPAIYSVAGSNKQETYTSVYTSNSADYLNQTRYPDLIEPYENNEILNAHLRRQHSYSTTSQNPPDNLKRLNRSYSTSGDGVANHEGYKTAMHRTMFPSGNITDALSYYPTSTRYESGVYNIPPAEYAEPHGWLSAGDNQFPLDNASTSSSLRSMETESCYSQSPYADRRNRQGYQNQMPCEPNYPKAWNQRPEIPHLELDLRNRNVPDYMQQQHQGEFYDSTGVIVSQSGYISISSDINQDSQQKKKIRRGNTLKSAMSSMTHWFPDLHITKRSRSYSLPESQGLDEKNKNIPVTKQPNTARKKKKNALMSTMSGILHKAKRKTPTQAQSQSLSDPEQSENEWILRPERVVVSEDDRSEDSCSIFSETQYERENLFEKVISSKAKPTRMEEEFPEMIDEDESLPQFSTVKLIPPKQQFETKSDIEGEVSDSNQNDEEISGKSTGSGSSGIFATIGDVKRSSAQSEKSEDSASSDSRFPPVTLGGASMEFAVSRALKKYRERQTTVSEDLNGDEYNGKLEENDLDVGIEKKKENEHKTVREQKSNDSQGSDAKSISNEEHLPESSPSSMSLRGNLGRVLTRHPQSLEIPGFRGEDEDNRSTHSWRSGSRVSSRRQSTEDSIDSEDEWFIHELKKLEEVERQSQLEMELGEPPQEEVEDEYEDSYEPDEEVKEKMSFVLRELRIKAKVVDGILEEKDNNRHVIASAKHRETQRKIEEKHSPEENSYIDERPEYEWVEDIAEEEDETSIAEEHSSGETSGPDSPHQSQDEYEEGEVAEEFARCHKLEPSELEEYELREAMEIREEPGTTLPRIKIENCGKEDSKDSGPLGSKWKLLKALKERKAEEKSKEQEKITETAAEKDKVSMLGMVKNFYEIHVKT